MFSASCCKFQFPLDSHLMSMAIETVNLSKQYTADSTRWRPSAKPPSTAVDNVSLSIKKGELFGLLGPNGAGKTTLTKMLCTLILPTSGSATIAGYPLSQPERIRAAVGLVVNEERSFYWRLSAYNNLRFFAALHGLFGRTAETRIQQLLQDVELTAYADRRFSNFSSGMKQRLAIARALLHEPTILFLDEPSRSLDPTATEKLHELIYRLMDVRQVTIFLITHDLAEAEKLCERVAVMHEGRVQVAGAPQQLRQQLEHRLQYKIRIPHTAAVTSLTSQFPELRLTRSADQMPQLCFQAGEGDGRLTAIIDQLRQQQIPILSISSHPPTLEEVFHHFTQPTAAP